VRWLAVRRQARRWRAAVLRISCVFSFFGRTEVEGDSNRIVGALPVGFSGISPANRGRQRIACRRNDRRRLRSREGPRTREDGEPVVLGDATLVRHFVGYCRRRGLLRSSINETSATAARFRRTLGCAESPEERHKSTARSRIHAWADPGSCRFRGFPDLRNER
jgi:hypothetical protein